MPTEADDLARLLHKFDGRPWTKRVRRSDPSLGHLIQQLSSSARTIAEALEELHQLDRDAPERAHLAETLRIAHELTRRMPPEDVKSELAAVLRALGMSEENQRMLARRLGWDGKGGTTLEAAAGGRVTRERVRQLEGELVNFMQREKPLLPAVQGALEMLAEAAPLSRDQAADLVVAENFAQTSFDPQGLIKAAQLAGLVVPILLAGNGVYAEGTQRTARHVLELARRNISHKGAGDVTSLADRANLDPGMIRRILGLEVDLQWLDDGREWFYLPGENRAAKYLRKMLAVSRSLQIADVREGMRRYPDREINLPTPILRRLCHCFDWITIDGDSVTALTALDYRTILENTERTMVDIFHDHGPVLDRARAVELGEQHGLNRTTTGLYLGWSPVIQRLTTNRYALRGADVPAGTLEAMRNSTPRRRVQRGYGWRSSGRLWIGYVLSQAVIDSHVVGVPSGLKNELNGRYPLAAPNDDLGGITTDGANLWGLARLLRRYAAEDGDALIFEFDLAPGIVHALVGGRDLLDSENRPPQVVTEEDSDDPTVSVPTGHEASSGGDEATIGPDSEWEVFIPSKLSLLDDQMTLAPQAPSETAPPELPSVTTGNEDSARPTRRGGRPVGARDSQAHTTLIEALNPSLQIRRHLERLVGSTIQTVSGKSNEVVDVRGDQVLVRTARSAPSSAPVSISAIQDSYDRLIRWGEIEVSVDSLGYRSAFIAAVLLTIPGTRCVQSSPPRIAIVRPDD
jgi:hypothetical protein